MKIVKIADSTMTIDQNEQSLSTRFRMCEATICSYKRQNQNLQRELLSAKKQLANLKKCGTFVLKQRKKAVSGCSTNNCNGAGNTANENFHGSHRNVKNCPIAFFSNMNRHEELIAELRESNLKISTELAFVKSSKQ